MQSDNITIDEQESISNVIRDLEWDNLGSSVYFICNFIIIHWCSDLKGEVGFLGTFYIDL